MATPSITRAPLRVLKRARISAAATTTTSSSTTMAANTPSRRWWTSEGDIVRQFDHVDIRKVAEKRGIQLDPLVRPIPAELDEHLQNNTHTPKNVLASQLAPLRREPTYGIPMATLQLRTYSLDNMLLFADLAMRAAYYLHLPAKGPVPLPKITERWTVPKSNFIFKKAQENFARITHRRLIQILDGHPDAVKVWLAFLAKHQYHGVGMKANLFEFDRLGFQADMGVDVPVAERERTWASFQPAQSFPRVVRPTLGEDGTVQAFPACPPYEQAKDYRSLADVVRDKLKGSRSSDAWSLEDLADSVPKEEEVVGGKKPQQQQRGGKPAVGKGGKEGKK